MPTFIIERSIEGASTLSPDELADIAATSNRVVDGLGVPYRWITSYVAGDKIYLRPRDRRSRNHPVSRPGGRLPGRSRGRGRRGDRAGDGRLGEGGLSIRLLDRPR